MHSGISRTLLWSAEHPTAERIQAARRWKRKNSFHAEEALPEADPAELSDYARSGYDRGHLVPNDKRLPFKSHNDRGKIFQAGMVDRDWANCNSKLLMAMRLAGLVRW